MQTRQNQVKSYHSYSFMKAHFSTKLGKFFEPNLLQNKFYFRLERFDWIKACVFGLEFKLLATRNKNKAYIAKYKLLSWHNYSKIKEYFEVHKASCLKLQNRKRTEKDIIFTL